MLISIDTFQLVDGTLSGGADVTDFRIRVDRIYDVVPALQQIDPVFMDRELRKFDIAFSVTRVHESIDAAEQYIQNHDAAVPDTGLITFTTVSGLLWTLTNGALLYDNLTKETGATTIHQYNIVGGQPFAPAPVAGFMLVESGDHMLLETGDKMLLEG